MESEAWNKLFKRSLSFNIFNALILTNIFSIFLMYLDVEQKYPTEIEKLPSTIVFIAQCLFCMIFEDASFYISHRLLHSSWLYPYIHKIHHENKVVYCLAAIHAHPIEYLFGNILPLSVGPIILGHRLHRAAMFGWFFIRGCETVDAHCGYDFPWSPFRLLPF